MSVESRQLVERFIVTKSWKVDPCVEWS